jgi:hypothetical protein
VLRHKAPGDGADQCTGREVNLFGVNYSPQSSHWLRQLDSVARCRLKLGRRTERPDHSIVDPLGPDDAKKLEAAISAMIDDDLDDLKALKADLIRVAVWDVEISDQEGNVDAVESSLHLRLLHHLLDAAVRRGLWVHLTPINWFWSSTYEKTGSFSRTFHKKAFLMGGPAVPDGATRTLFEIQENYLKQLLDSRSPQTGRAIKELPNLAVVEILGEPEVWSFEEMRKWVAKECTDPARQGGCPDGLRWPYGSPASSARPLPTGAPSLAAVLRSFHSSAGRAGESFDSFLERMFVQRTGAQAYADLFASTAVSHANRMFDVIRGAGVTAPITMSAHPLSQLPRDSAMFKAYSGALQGSRAECIGLGQYPGAYDSRNTDQTNLLPETERSALDESYLAIGKCPVVYEYGLPGTVHRVYMFPALARKWREMGVQVASFFQYDSRAGAPINGMDWGFGGPRMDEWWNEWLNLYHTPHQAVSFLAARLTFAALPLSDRGGYQLRRDYQTFSVGAVSFGFNQVIYDDGSAYASTGSSPGWDPFGPAWWWLEPWRGLGPRRPSQIYCNGDCKYLSAQFERDPRTPALMESEGQRSLPGSVFMEEVVDPAGLFLQLRVLPAVDHQPGKCLDIKNANPIPGPNNCGSLGQPLTVPLPSWVTIRLTSQFPCPERLGTAIQVRSVVGGQAAWAPFTESAPDRLPPGLHVLADGLYRVPLSAPVLNCRR